MMLCNQQLVIQAFKLAKHERKEKSEVGPNKIDRIMPPHPHPSAVGGGGSHGDKLDVDPRKQNASAKRRVLPREG
jgi:hypothetical protein